MFLDKNYLEANTGCWLGCEQKCGILALWYCVCERSRPSLSQLVCWHDRQRIPLQNVAHSGNDPCLVPGFLRQHSVIFPERFRRMPVPVGSREFRPIFTEHPRCRTLSCWVAGTVFQWPSPQSLQKFVLYTPQWFQEPMWFATGCSLGYSRVSLDTAANFR